MNYFQEIYLITFCLMVSVWSDVTVNGVRENIKESVHSLTGLSSYQAALLHLKDMGSNSVTRKFKVKSPVME